MFQWIRDCLIARRRARLDRLTQLAREMDELLAFGRLSDATRAHLQAGRNDLQRQVREMMFG